jgi:transcriptional regulator with XRE-family HTH domain
MAERRPTIRSKWLGEDLRRKRQSAKMAIADVAKGLDWPASKVSRIENGLVRAHWLDVKALLDLYGVLEDDPLREALINLAKSVRKKDWWHGYGARLNHPFADLLSLESIANRISTYQIQLVPGLLQTPAYAQAVTLASRVWETEEDVDKFVEVRVNRQAVLTRDDPLDLWVIINEGALRQVIGSPDIMKEQLRHLASMARRPNVTIQVLPYGSGASAGMVAPFVKLELPGPGALDLVYLENLTGALFLEQENEVRHYTIAFDHLRASALPTAKSVKFITDRAKEL